MFIDHNSNDSNNNSNNNNSHHLYDTESELINFIKYLAHSHPLFLCLSLFLERLQLQEDPLHQVIHKYLFHQYLIPPLPHFEVKVTFLSSCLSLISGTYKVDRLSAISVAIHQHIVDEIL